MIREADMAFTLGQMGSSMKGSLSVIAVKVKVSTPGQMEHLTLVALWATKNMDMVFLYWPMETSLRVNMKRMNEKAMV
jgi:hypothetical protein